MTHDRRGPTRTRHSPSAPSCIRLTLRTQAEIKLSTVGVVARAWQVLQLLEQEHHVAGRPVPPLPDASQLALFAGERGPHPLLDELAKIDVNTLSPLEALSRLAAMQRRLTEGK